MKTSKKTKSQSNKPNNMLTPSELSYLKKGMQEATERARKKGLKIYGEPDTSSSKPNNMLTPSEINLVKKDLQEFGERLKKEGLKVYGED